MSDLTNPAFHNEEVAREWLEARVWAHGRVCPHCGAVDESTLMKGKSHRAGVYQCNACRKPFSVTVGTLYERSHIPLHKWLAATHLLMASKKGMSAMQIHRMLGLTYKSAWFMMHRIRESLRETVAEDGPLGGDNKVVEAPRYQKIGDEFAGHGTVNHSIEEYVRAFFWHTNTAEGYFSILKRGIVGTYHHVSAEHLHRYLAEFDYRYNKRVALGVSDRERMEKSVQGIVGRRLTYRRTSQQSNQQA